MGGKKINLSDRVPVDLLAPLGFLLFAVPEALLHLLAQVPADSPLVEAKLLRQLGSGLKDPLDSIDDVPAPQSQAAADLQIDQCAC